MRRGKIEHMVFPLIVHGQHHTLDLAFGIGIDRLLDTGIALRLCGGAIPRQVERTREHAGLHVRPEGERQVRGEDENDRTRIACSNHG